MEAAMAASDYTHGEMDIDSQKKMYSGFMKAGAWSGILMLLALGYATLALSVGLHWLVALVLCAGAGIVIGLGMGFGAAWVATVIGLSGVAVFIQVLVILFKMVL
jgi:hypothetical protein